MFLGSFPLMLRFLGRVQICVCRGEIFFKNSDIPVVLGTLMTSEEWWENDPDLLFLSSDKCWCSAQTPPVPHRAFQRFKENFHVQMLTDPQTGIVTNTHYPEQMLLPLKELPPKLMFVQTEESINCWFYLKMKTGFTEFCVILQLAQFC